MKKLPPIEKVYEAWSALADERIALTSPHSARVVSSDGAKEYEVRYDAATDTYASDDSATYWRGYPGYPVIAMMMLQGRIPYDIPESNLWGGVNWTTVNAAHKRDYAAAAQQVAAERNIDLAHAHEAAERVMARLAELDAKVKRLVRK